MLPYRWITFDAVHGRVLRFSAGLAHTVNNLNLPVAGGEHKSTEGGKDSSANKQQVDGFGRFVGISSINRLEWIITDVACFYNGEQKS